MINWSCILEHNAEWFPEKEAIIFNDRRLTYSEVKKRVDSLAQGLLEMGIEPGSTVAILLYNCSEFLEITFAVNRIGAFWLPLNFRLTPKDFEFILEHSDSRAILTEAAFTEAISSIKDNLPKLDKFVLVGEGAAEGWLSYDEIIKKHWGADPEHYEVKLDDIHRLMYTSGTTARPKGVMLTYENLYWKNLGHIITCEMTASDKTLVVGPLYHVGGMDLPGTGTIHVGGTLVIHRQFDPANALKTIEEEKITNLWLAPAMMNRVLNEPSFDKYDLSTLRFIIDGGEKMPEALIKQIQSKFPNTWFADAYGLTETVSGDTFLSKAKGLEKVGSVGKPVPHLEVAIMDDDDNQLGPNQRGEICFRGPKVFKGYWKDPEATASTIKNGWFHTGDIGEIDDEGYLYIVDRKKDIIISGGENISSLEVEGVIYKMPEVLEVAVVGIPHPTWVETPKAYVVKKSGETLAAEDVINHCRENLAKFKVPKEIEFIDELPRNPSGKILKRRLRET